jgi:hypothetical protein
MRAIKGNKTGPLCSNLNSKKGNINLHSYSDFIFMFAFDLTFFLHSLKNPGNLKTNV